MPDALAVDERRPALRRLLHRLAVELDPDELPRHALAPDPLERLLADVVGLCSSTRRSRPVTSNGFVSRPKSEPQSKMPASIRRISDEGVTRIPNGLPASRIRPHRSSPRLGSRR